MPPFLFCPSNFTFMMRTHFWFNLFLCIHRICEACVTGSETAKFFPWRRNALLTDIKIQLSSLVRWMPVSYRGKATKDDTPVLSAAWYRIVWASVERGIWHHVETIARATETLWVRAIGHPGLLNDDKVAFWCGTDVVLRGDYFMQNPSWLMMA